MGLRSWLYVVKELGLLMGSSDILKRRAASERQLWNEVLAISLLSLATSERVFQLAIQSVIH